MCVENRSKIGGNIGENGVKFGEKCVNLCNGMYMGRGRVSMVWIWICIWGVGWDVYMGVEQEVCELGIEECVFIEIVYWEQDV